MKKLIMVDEDGTLRAGEGGQYLARTLRRLKRFFIYLFIFAYFTPILAQIKQVR